MWRWFVQPRCAAQHPQHRATAAQPPPSGEQEGARRGQPQRPLRPCPPAFTAGVAAPAIIGGETRRLGLRLGRGVGGGAGGGLHAKTK